MPGFTFNERRSMKGPGMNRLGEGDCARCDRRGFHVARAKHSESKARENRDCLKGGLCLPIRYGRLLLVTTIVAAIFGVEVSLGDTIVFDNEDEFVANLAPDFYHDDLCPGGDGLCFEGNLGVSSLDFGPVNGFSFTAEAATGELWNLSSDEGWLADGFQGSPLTYTFTGDDVFMVGGHFWGTDGVDGFPASGTLEISINDGTSVSLTNPTTETFTGFMSTEPITSLTVNPIHEGSPWWGVSDDLFVGTAIPAPGAFALLSIACLSLRRRKRT